MGALAMYSIPCPEKDKNLFRYLQPLRYNQ